MTINWLATTAVALVIGTGAVVAQSQNEQKREETPRAQQTQSKDNEPGATDRKGRSAQPDSKGATKEERGEPPSDRKQQAQEPGDRKQQQQSQEQQKGRDARQPESKQSQEGQSKQDNQARDTKQPSDTKQTQQDRSKQENQARDSKQPDTKQTQQDRSKQENQARDAKQPTDTKQQQGQQQPSPSTQPSAQSTQQGTQPGNTGQNRTGQTPGQTTTGQTTDPNRSGSTSASATGQDRQRTEVFDRLRRDRSVSNQNIDIRVDVGQRLPPRVRVRPLPPDIARIEPRYRGYQYTVVEDQIYIVNPRTREVVDVIREPGPGTRTTYRSESERIVIPREQRETFKQVARRSMTTSQTSGAPSGSSPSSGSSASLSDQSCLPLQPVPEELTRNNPELSQYRYVAIGDQIILVDPRQQKVVEVID